MNTPHSKNSVSGTPRAGQHPVLGVLVLAFGIACLAGVGTLAWFKYYKQHSFAPNTSSEALADATALATAQPENPRQKKWKNYLKPSLQDIQGTWETNLSNGRATLVMAKGAFRLTYTNDKKGRLRKYTSGRYRYNEKTGRLSFEPIRGFAKPKALPGVTYKILTLRYFDALLLKDNKSNGIFWMPPGQDRSTRSPNPLFFYNGNGENPPVIEWKKANN